LDRQDKPFAHARIRQKAKVETYKTKRIEIFESTEKIGFSQIVETYKTKRIEIFESTEKIGFSQITVEL